MSGVLKKAFGYSAIESVGSRIFDFITLWILLNTLPKMQLADYGVASSLLFVFNFIFIAPETNLFRDQKKWKENGELDNYLSAYFSFSFIKIGLLYTCTLGVVAIYGVQHWFLITILLAIATQQIQLAEITRIYHRMELHQKNVASFELVSKLLLALVCSVQFLKPGIFTYLGIYVSWSAIIGLIWFIKLSKKVNLSWLGFNRISKYLLGSLLGFSLWQHISSTLTMYIYNVDPLFLKIFDVPFVDLANYTAALKISNLFFVIPMFFQSFVPVALANAGDNKKNVFNKILKVNGALAFAQLIFFLLIGYFIAPIIGIEKEQQKQFYTIACLINIGVLILNLARPLSTYLLINYSVKRMLFIVFIPTALIATIAYAAGTAYGGVIGCATASAIGYGYFGFSLLWLYLSHSKNSRLVSV